MEEYYKLLLSLGLSLLIGLEREWERQVRKIKTLFGIRSATLLSLLTILILQLSKFTSLNFSIALIIVISLSVGIAAYFLRYKKFSLMGITSLLALLMIPLITLLVFLESYIMPVIITVITTILLASFQELHGFTRKIRKVEMFSFLKFLIISLVILPLIPNYYFYNVNIFEFWKIVTLFSFVQFFIYIVSIRLKKSKAAIYLSSMINSEATFNLIKDEKAIFIVNAGMLASQIFIFLIMNKINFYIIKFIVSSLLLLLISFKFNLKVKVKLEPLSLLNSIKFAVLFFIISLLINNFKEKKEYLIIISSFISSSATIASLLQNNLNHLIPLAISITLLNRIVFGFKKDKKYLLKVIKYSLISEIALLPLLIKV